MPLPPPSSPINVADSDSEDDTTIFGASSSPLKLPSPFKDAILAQDVDAISCADDPSYCPDHGYQAVTQQFPPFTLQSSSIEADTTTALDRDDMTVFSLSFSSLKPSATFQDGGCMNSILSDFEGINEDAMTLSATDDDMSAIHDLDPRVP